MKKFLITGLCLFCLFLTGCSKSGTTVTDPPLVSEDFPAGETSRPLMLTQQGIYYNSEFARTTDNNLIATGMINLHYYDYASGKNVFLCNKPECKHDGNEFCTATNDSYIVLATQLYSGKIYLAVQYYDDTKLAYKLLCASLDGSSLSEIVTYYEQENPEISYVVSDLPSSFMLIHRNKVFLQLYTTKNKNIESTPMFGTMVYDLETGKLTSIYEENCSEQNPMWHNISARGDYIYYVVQEPHKKRLHRIHITDLSDEVMELVPNFTGEYCLFDDDSICYKRAGGRSIFVHHIAENTNEEKKVLKIDAPVIFTLDDSYDLDESGLRPGDTIEDGVLHATIPDFQITYTDLYSDGEYLYVYDGIYYVRSYAEGRNPFVIHNVLYVFDSGYNCIAMAHIPSSTELKNIPSDPDNPVYYLDTSLHFLGEKIYVTGGDIHRTDDVYCMDRAALLEHRNILTNPECQLLIDSSEIPYPVMPNFISIQP